jgi:hypothetical protein
MTEAARDEEREDLERKLRAKKEGADQGLVIRPENRKLIEGNLHPSFRMTADQVERVVTHFCERDRN